MVMKTGDKVVLNTTFKPCQKVTHFSNMFKMLDESYQTSRNEDTGNFYPFTWRCPIPQVCIIVVR